MVQAKMEYHGNKASDAEEVTAEELVRWWSASHIRPGSHVLVSAAQQTLLLKPARSLGLRVERFHDQSRTKRYHDALLS